jgi:pimeloyl-ACP methyl ester carboxylesterase
MSRFAELGLLREVELREGTIRYRDIGRGEPIVFVHGVFCNGDLWRKVVPRLAREFRCITPDWPLGSHARSLSRDANLTPPGVAGLIDEFSVRLGLGGVTLVGNDTGGAFCQLVAVNNPAWLGRLVLTSCDAFEHFPPALLKPGTLLGYAPPLMFLVGQALRPRPMQRLMYRWSASDPVPDEVLRSYSENGLRSPRVVRDLGRVMRAMRPRYTLAAGEQLRGFAKPTLIAWGDDDQFFPEEDGRKLAARIPDSRFVLVKGSRTFISEDQPEELARLIAEFMRESPADQPRGPVAAAR